jgi:hypothetical protein
LWFPVHFGERARKLGHASVCDLARRHLVEQMKNHADAGEVHAQIFAE